MLQSLSIIVLKESPVSSVDQLTALSISCPPEEGGHVVVLQHRLVVVDDGQVRGGLDVEVVGRPGVVVVVDDGGEEEREDLQVRHPVLQSSLGDAAVSGLQDVAGVQVVVVGGSVTEMVRLY